MNKGPTLEKIQASQTRVLVQMIAALPDRLSVEEACALTAEVKQLALVDACENQLLQSISRAMEKESGNEKQISNRKSLQSWQLGGASDADMCGQIHLTPKVFVGPNPSCELSWPCCFGCSCYYSMQNRSVFPLFLDENFLYFVVFFDEHPTKT